MKYWYRLKWEIRRIFRNRKLDKSPTETLLELVPVMFTIGILYSMMPFLCGFKSREEYLLYNLNLRIQKTAFLLDNSWMWRNFNV